MKSSIGGGYRKKIMGFHLALIFSEPDVKKFNMAQGKGIFNFAIFFRNKKLTPVKQKTFKGRLINFKKQ